MFSIFGVPLALTIASSRMGIDSINFFVISGEIFDSSIRAIFKSFLFDIFLFLICKSKICHKFSIGFISGDWGGVTSCLGTLYKSRSFVFFFFCNMLMIVILLKIISPFPCLIWLHFQISYLATTRYTFSFSVHQ